MDFSAPLRQGTLIRRYKRFLVDIELPDGGLPACDAVYEGLLSLPMFPDLGDDDVRHGIEDGDVEVRHLLERAVDLLDGGLDGHGPVLAQPIHLTGNGRIFFRSS